jgi:hypothetical protein
VEQKQRSDVSNDEVGPPKMYRNYSISSKEDLININKGRCPEYALEWDKESNKPHWSEGHDYIIGFNIEETDNEYNKSIHKMMKTTNYTNDVVQNISNNNTIIITIARGKKIISIKYIQIFEEEYQKEFNNFLLALYLQKKISKTDYDELLVFSSFTPFRNEDVQSNNPLTYNTQDGLTIVISQNNNENINHLS